ncbi:MAG: amidohydrolase [Chloroflexi bacterium HGW-Chloroflexi-8]|nr:MAG: amidohydrolase [Chloroflexi bacterium HGW-Chloroflexi-8]
MMGINRVKIDSNIIDYAIHKRRDFHKFPEIGFKEFRTSNIIKNELLDMGFEVQSGIAETGVIGIWPGEKNKPVIMLRFDMDALPIAEENEIEYKSTIKGLMHACGHDAHISIGLGLAKVISTHTKNNGATIKFVFQPAEEGLGGAERMVAEGVLNNPKPDYCLGVHVWNEKPINWVGIKSGPFMAGAITFKLEIIGKGGHGAIPNEAKDPIVASAIIIQALQSIVSRNISPLESGVVSVCSIHGGSAFNVIPQNVEIFGTARYFKPEIQKIILARIESIVNSIASSFNCDAKLEINEITPAVINNNDVIEFILNNTAKKYPEMEFETQYQSMGSEDYSFYLNEIPGCFIFMGAGLVSGEKRYGHHHPRFNIDERVIGNSISFLYEALTDLTEN